jgi:hypothetical protein
LSIAPPPEETYLTLETPEKYVLIMKVVQSSSTEALFILTSYVGATTQWLGGLVRKAAAGRDVESWDLVSRGGSRGRNSERRIRVAQVVRVP